MWGRRWGRWGRTGVMEGRLGQDGLTLPWGYSSEWTRRILVGGWSEILLVLKQNWNVVCTVHRVYYIESKVETKVDRFCYAREIEQQSERSWLEMPDLECFKSTIVYSRAVSILRIQSSEFRDRPYLRGEGVKNWANLSTDSSKKLPMVGVKNREKFADVLNGWSLWQGK